MKNEAIAILKMADEVVIEKTNNHRVDQMSINHIELIEDLKIGRASCRERVYVLV